MLFQIRFMRLIPHVVRYRRVAHADRKGQQMFHQVNPPRVLVSLHRLVTKVYSSTGLEKQLHSVGSQPMEQPVEQFIPQVLNLPVIIEDHCYFWQQGSLCHGETKTALVAEFWH